MPSEVLLFSNIDFVASKLDLSLPFPFFSAFVSFLVIFNYICLNLTVKSKIDFRKIDRLNFALFNP